MQPDFGEWHRKSLKTNCKIQIGRGQSIREHHAKVCGRKDCQNSIPAVGDEEKLSKRVASVLTPRLFLFPV
jgi:hypothetical protein